MSQSAADGQVVLVTGGGSGMGAATVRLAVERGYQVAFADLDNDQSNHLAKELGGAACFLPTDIADPARVDATFARLREHFGRLDVSITTAGISDRVDVLGEGATPLEAFQHVLDVNLIGVLDVVSHSIALMQHNEPDFDGQRGVIVTVSSIAAFAGWPGHVAYGASKAGLAMATLPLARELGGYGIRAMNIAPGGFDTPMVNAITEEDRVRRAGPAVYPKRLGEPIEFARFALALLDHRLLNGEVIRLDAGARL
jgi:3-hydroxyacyl-CoA dehydrogenase / 3-hydroxy-2-methylbutyryl-CoA dehydrogenase